MPQLRWPLPRPSAAVTLNPSEFNWQTYGDIDRYLARQLQARDYEFTYFLSPNGYALAAKVERIEEDASSSAVDRWLFENRRSISVADAVWGVFTAPSGYFRLIIFVVSEQPFQTSAESLAPTAARSLWASGVGWLHAELKAQPVTENTRVTALIYEYRSRGYEFQASLQVPGKHSANTHLRQSRLLTIAGENR